MAVTTKRLLGTKFAENAQTTQYTAPAGNRTTINKFTAYNGAASTVTITVNLVDAGGAAGAANVKVSKNIASGETYTFPEIVGHTLNAGDFISTIAGAASSIVIRLSGREDS